MTSNPKQTSKEKSLPKPYIVYILLCKDETLYTGITTDMARRFAVHQSGKGARYTRVHTPLFVVYREKKKDRSLALKREAAIKKLSRDEKLLLIKNTKKLSKA